MIGKWFIKQVISLQVYLYQRSGGKMMGTLGGMPILLLTSVGRKSGQLYVNPLMYIRDGDSYVITASYGGADKHPSWFLNLRAHPQTIIQVGDQRINVTAQQANPEQRACLWAQLVKQAPMFEDYEKKTTREIPMVILQPAPKAMG